MKTAADRSSAFGNGARMFVEGNLEVIEAMFRPFAQQVRLVTWRRQSEPLSPVYMLSGYADDLPAYNLDIRAVREPALAERPRSYLFRSRAIRELLDHRLSYLFWKIKIRGKNALKRIRVSRSVAKSP